MADKTKPADNKADAPAPTQVQSTTSADSKGEHPKYEPTLLEQQEEQRRRAAEEENAPRPARTQVPDAAQVLPVPVPVPGTPAATKHGPKK